MSYKQEAFISHSPGGWESPRSRCQQIQYLVKTCFQIHRHLLPLSSHGGRAKGALWGLFLRTNHIIWTPPLWPYHLPKAHLLIPSHWRSGFNIQILGGHKHWVDRKSLLYVRPGQRLCPEDPKVMKTGHGSWRIPRIEDENPLNNGGGRSSAEVGQLKWKEVLIHLELWSKPSLRGLFLWL